MPIPKLSLARSTAQIVFSPKSVLVHSRGPELVSKFYPEPFPDWGHGSRGNRLLEMKTRLRATILGEMLELVAEPPSDTESITALIDDLSETYANTVGEFSDPTQLKLRQVFLTEHSSFDELFPHFRSNTLRHERSWAQIDAYSVRDLGFVDIYYGDEGNGLNLRIGIYTSEQVSEFFDEIDGFKSDEGELPLDAADGGLMVDLRRYQRNEDWGPDSEILSRWATHLEETAHRLTERTLQGM